jgi:hypothetical protein
VSATASALFVMFVGALVSMSVAVGPPSLPPEAGPPVPPPVTSESPATDPPAIEPPTTEPPATDPPADTREGGSGEGSQGSEVPPPPVRDSLPSGLQPVPFPLENQRRGPAPSDGANPPSEQRRSIVDLRDPFDRPPPRTRSDRSRDTRVRLLMPDLKDPFAHGVRRIRSRTLEQRIPNDIIDPFRGQPNGRPLCVKKTQDGTVVQGPNKQPVQSEECRPSRLDLRDPFR